MNLNLKISPFSISKVGRVIEENEINNFFGIILSKDLITFWNVFHEISFKNGINIYGFEIAKERNKQFFVKEYLPDFLLVGDDGGGQGIFVEKNNPLLNVFYLDFGALGSLPLKSLEIDLFHWLEEGPLIDNEEIDEYGLLEYVDIFVTKLPKDTTKFIIDVRRAFNLSISIKDIKSNLNNIPFILKENIILVKYLSKINEINDVYDCLEVVKK